MLNVERMLTPAREGVQIQALFQKEPALICDTWNPHVALVLNDLFKRGKFADRKVALDCDNTMLAHDCGEATFEVLVRDGQLTPGNLPRELRSVREQLCGEDLINFYKTYASRAVPQIVDAKEATKDMYRWVVQIMAGLTVQEVTSAAALAFDPGLGMKSFPTPYAHPEMVDLVRAARSGGADVWVVSASNPWSVRSAIANHYNPALTRAGCNPIPMENIIGLDVALIDRGGREVSDRDLVRNDRDYAEFNPGRLKELTLSSKIREPAPIFEGKATICSMLLDSEPLLAAGDSRSDFPMLERAQYKLFLSLPTKLALRDEVSTRAASDAGWLIQPLSAGEHGKLAWAPN